MIIIFIGLMLLLNNLGIISWNVWEMLFKFWPLFLVFGGIDVLIGDTLPGSILADVLATLIIAYIFIQVAMIDNEVVRQWVFTNMPWLPYLPEFFTPKGNEIPQWLGNGF